MQSQAAADPARAQPLARRDGRGSSSPGAAQRHAFWWHLLAVVSISGAYESLFVHHGIAWLFDEGWPLYAAMRLHDGGVLYADTFFPFPPGHLVPAWIAYALDPPGIVLARLFYAGFDVALCAAVYLLGRRITSPPFALLGALLLAIAAPRSHLAHLLFGYRYLVWSILVLLAFSARLRASDRASADRWMFVAGLAAGVALFFRLTPAFAVSCGVGVAVVTVTRDYRIWLRDWIAYGSGLALVSVPTLCWLEWSVGLEVVWREVVTRILALQSAQSLASPELTLLPATGERRVLYRWFVAVQYRLYIAMYACYVIALSIAWLRSLRRSEPFRGALLLAIAIFGGIYLLRALGRSDDHHLMSALPPACLILGHVVGSGVGALASWRDWEWSRGSKRAAVASLVVLLLAAWGYLHRTDYYLPRDRRGLVPIRATGGAVSVTSARTAQRIDRVVAAIRRSTAADAIVLDLTAGPLLHVLMQRPGPGVIDVISPGIFLSADEERAFVDRLAASPPARVIWPLAAFDKLPERSIRRTAPAVSAWVLQHYEKERSIDRYSILRPRRGKAGS